MPGNRRGLSGPHWALIPILEKEHMNNWLANRFTRIFGKTDKAAPAELVFADEGDYMRGVDNLYDARDNTVAYVYKLDRKVRVKRNPPTLEPVEE